MDTIIFVLILASLAAMIARRPAAARGLFVLALAVTVWLFWYHVSDPLNLNF